MQGHSIKDIAAALDAPFEGDGSLIVGSACEPADAMPGQLAVAMAPSYGDALAAGHAEAAILWQGADWKGYGLKAAIFVQRPRVAMAHLTRHMRDQSSDSPGIHPTALIDPSASLGKDARIDAYVVIGAHVVIGDNCRIGTHTTIAAGSRLGDEAILRAGVHIEDRVQIGDRFFAHAGVVVGSDGFSFVTPQESAVEKVRETMESAKDVAVDQSWDKIYSLGGVVIGDDVELGANTVIDAGTIRPTRVGSGTKVDALAQIGHNVTIGTDCLLCGHVGVAGSSVVGNNVVLAGQVGVADNITIGDGVIAGGASKIFSNVPAGRAVMGSPAMKMETHIETYKALRRLPRLVQQVQAIHERVSKLGNNS